MEEQDHAYTSKSEFCPISSELVYKMGEREVEEFVKLRMTNNSLFSGRKNSSIWAWRAILKHMGLQQKMTHYQAKKKWENMKKRYKDLKYPPEGVKVCPESWPYFSLMENALAGKLEGSAPLLTAFPNTTDSSDFLPINKPKKRKLPSMILANTSIADGPEVEVSLSGDEDGKEAILLDGSNELDFIMQDTAQTNHGLDDRQQVHEREWLVLQRERAVMDRELAVMERDRALVERERAMLEREKAMVERERAMVAKDRETICRERRALQQERERLQRLAPGRERNKEDTENDNEENQLSDSRDMRERFLNLFEKLFEKLEN